MSDIHKVAVIGAGLMGHGLAQIFAGSGYQTALLDLGPELLQNALSNIRANLTLMAEKGIGSVSEIESALSRIKTTTDMNEAVEGAGIIIEAVVEKLDVKQELFKELDSICPPETILATNTSVISITEIAAPAVNKARILGAHFWNPPYLIPLVEVIRGEETSPDVMAAAFRFFAGVGKKPVMVMKDVPGFVGNRLQHALWREAISIVENGIADAATVDEVVKNSFGLRLPVLGPLENADLVGLDLTWQIHDYILKYIEASPSPSPLLKEKIDAGDLGFKTGDGLQTWTPERMKSVREKLTLHLLDAVAKEKSSSRG
jgi:3-hydroxybutyryl-CoA dehydrogenase